MKIHLKKLLRVILVCLFFFFGILGLVLPILNGTIPLIIALIILSLDIPPLERYLDKHSRRNIRLEKIYLKIKHFTRKHL